MPRPPEWKVDSGLRTAGSTTYESVDKDGLFGDERTKLREVQDVLKQFAPSSAYHGDRNLRKMGEAMLDQFKVITRTRYESGEAQTQLQKVSAGYDEKVQPPTDQTPLAPYLEDIVDVGSEDGLVDALVKHTDNLPADEAMAKVDHFVAVVRHKVAVQIYEKAKKKNEEELKRHKQRFRQAVTDIQQMNVRLDDIVELTKFITSSRAKDRHQDVDEEVQRVCAKINKDVPEGFAPATAAAAPAATGADLRGTKRPALTRTDSLVINDQISLKHLLKKLQEKQEEPVGATLADDDGDGNVDIDEFGDWWTDYCEEVGLNKPSAEDIAAEWATFAKGEGILSHDEYNARIKELQEEINEESMSAAERIKAKRRRKKATSTASSSASDPSLDLSARVKGGNDSVSVDYFSDFALKFSDLSLLLCDRLKGDAAQPDPADQPDEWQRYVGRHAFFLAERYREIYSHSPDYPHRCAITLQDLPYMNPDESTDSVVWKTPCGHFFVRNALFHWIAAGNHTCPVSRNVLGMPTADQAVDGQHPDDPVDNFVQLVVAGGGQQPMRDPVYNNDGEVRLYSLGQAYGPQPDLVPGDIVAFTQNWGWLSKAEVTAGRVIRLNRYRGEINSAIVICLHNRGGHNRRDILRRDGSYIPDAGSFKPGQRFKVPIQNVRQLEDVYGVYWPSRVSRRNRDWEDPVTDDTLLTVQDVLDILGGAGIDNQLLGYDAPRLGLEGTWVHAVKADAYKSEHIDIPGAGEQQITFQDPLSGDIITGTPQGLLTQYARVASNATAELAEEQRENQHLREEMRQAKGMAWEVCGWETDSETTYTEKYLDANGGLYSVYNVLSKFGSLLTKEVSIASWQRIHTELEDYARELYVSTYENPPLEPEPEDDLDLTGRTRGGELGEFEVGDEVEIKKHRNRGLVGLIISETDTHYTVETDKGDIVVTKTNVKTPEPQDPPTPQQPDLQAQMAMMMAQLQAMQAQLNQKDQLVKQLSSQTSEPFTNPPFPPKPMWDWQPTPTSEPEPARIISSESETEEEEEEEASQPVSVTESGLSLYGLQDQFVCKGDVFVELTKLPDNSVDFLYTNPPFGITGASWDKSLLWDRLWPHIWRVLKDDGVVVLHCSMPFTSDLIASQRKYYRYSYVWEKNNSTGFLQAKFQPMRIHEDVVVFYKKAKGTYNPQMVGDEFHKKRNVTFGGDQQYWGQEGQQVENEETEEGGHTGRYPTTLLQYPIKKGAGGAATRTEEMVEFFIKTYSNEGDTVLDITCYDAITGAVCRDLNRKYIGIDIDPQITNGIPVMEGDDPSEHGSPLSRVLTDKEAVEMAMEKFGPSMKDNDAFATPPAMLDEWSDYTGLDLKTAYDPCPWYSPDKPWPPPDGLAEDWFANSADQNHVVFCNPPFSRSWPWMKKSVDEAKKGCTVVLLLSADTVLKSGAGRRHELTEYTKQANFKFIRWHEDLDFAIIHRTQAWKNKLTGKPGGPRFGVVGICITAKDEPDSEEEELPASQETVDSVQSATTKVSSCWGNWATPGVPQMKVLELFSGTGSVSKVAKIIDAHIESVDINEETAGHKPTKVIDLLNFEPEMTEMVPDIITASPPCQTYSIMSGAKHRYASNFRDNQVAVGVVLDTEDIWDAADLTQLFFLQNEE